MGEADWGGKGGEVEGASSGGRSLREPKGKGGGQRRRGGKGSDGWMDGEVRGLRDGCGIMDASMAGRMFKYALTLGPFMHPSNRVRT